MSVEMTHGAEVRAGTALIGDMTVMAFVRNENARLNFIDVDANERTVFTSNPNVPRLLQAQVGSHLQRLSRLSAAAASGPPPPSIKDTLQAMTSSPPGSKRSKKTSQRK